MDSRKFETYDEAIAYLSNEGRLDYFGRIGLYAETYVYNLTLPSGHLYHLLIDNDGMVNVIDTFK